MVNHVKPQFLGPCRWAPLSMVPSLRRVAGSFIPSRKVFSGVGGMNVVLACLRLFWSCFPFFDRIFDAKFKSFCRLLQDTRPSVVSNASLWSNCLFPRPCRASVHGAWPACATEVSLPRLCLQVMLYFPSREECLPGDCWWSTGFQGFRRWRVFCTRHLQRWWRS
ncbi:uncharacterized protein LOC133855200 [Alnus glutinosa]|uniref:uncharacterized protein LOC133855200 n=1 Tax=Alnus glutinosa TaxID=3517 RepID=UPI002D7817AE|nr:uncharacterized protein LOC133855200 [Alnus glutinosa]